MEKNIFEGAKFGDKFLTMDGRVAVLLFPHYGNNTTVKLGIEEGDEFVVYLDGSVDTRFWQDNLSIKGRYHEPIDEEKLDELARSIYNSDTSNSEFLYQIQRAEIIGFKAGYRKATEE